MVEAWKPIPGWEGYYEASSLGRIRSVSRKVVRKDGLEQGHRGKIITAYPDRKGYLDIRLNKGNRKRHAKVHRLVAAAFHGMPSSDDLFCCHNNGNRQDNRPENLRWDTPKSNYADMEKHGTNHWLNKKFCPRGHPLINENCAPWALQKGQRTCWACAKSRSLALKRNEKDYYKYADSYLSNLLPHWQSAA
ncbi:NUMOD4 motif-containing HNH endonuclease [Corynebacterium simulans]|uniref:NUMOD4 motif-containing HNH endonuclease n=1 Tax=Corynebacterium simulans TaxID=146827 RepID=UPI0009EB0D32|nr:NUMOD4 motif-containing HNH endonuclease [Corynebacterium simulans]